MESKVSERACPDGREFAVSSHPGSVGTRSWAHPLRPSSSAELSEGSKFSYEFRIFVPRCETYAIRLKDEQITGIYGPLEYDEVLFGALPHFQYEDRPDEVAWVESNLCDFAMCETEYDDTILWI